MRVKVTLACTECKQRNYNKMKNKKNNPDRLEIVWPSRKQIVKSTAVVLLMVFIAGVVIWGFDTILGFLVNLLLKNA